jgi:hypothetical protein
LQSAKPIALALVIAIFTVIGVRIIAELRDVLVLLFIAVLFASAACEAGGGAGAASRSTRACCGIVQAGIGFFVGVLWLVVPPLVAQLALFGDRLPSYVTWFQHVSDEYAAVKRQYTPARKRSSPRWRVRPADWPATSAANSSTSR